MAEFTDTAIHRYRGSQWRNPRSPGISLKKIVVEDGCRPLETLAGTILSSVRGFGKQSDDQTLLLIRRL